MDPLISKETLLVYVEEIYDYLKDGKPFPGSLSRIITERDVRKYGDMWWNHPDLRLKLWDETMGLLRHAVSIAAFDRSFDWNEDRRALVPYARMGEAIKVLEKKE